MLYNAKKSFVTTLIREDAMISKRNVVTLILGIALLNLTNCTTAQSSLTPTETPSLATETPIPLKTLKICLGDEPGSLSAPLRLLLRISFQILLKVPLDLVLKVYRRINQRVILAGVQQNCGNRSS